MATAYVIPTERRAMQLMFIVSKSEIQVNSIAAIGMLMLHLGIG